jgi:hypothetical protein
MKGILKQLLRQIPSVDNYLSDREFRSKYTTEIALWNKSAENSSVKPSVLHFSVNKAATQFVKKKLRQLAFENGMEPVHFHEYAFLTDRPYFDHLSKEQMKKYQFLFKPKGYVYSVFGGMISNIDQFSSYRVLLTVRDPRDILVSNYFSKAYSHRIPPEGSTKREQFLKDRERVKQTGIDEYVLQRGEEVYKIYESYKNELLAKHDNVGVVTYEKMVSDFSGWLDEISDITGLKISATLKHRLIEEFERNRVEKEDKQRHRRKGVPGDYQEKLKPETIAQLNQKFEDLMLSFGYRLNS